MKKIFTITLLLVYTLTYAQEQKKQSSFKNFVKKNYVNYTDFGGLFGKSYQIFYNGSNYGNTVPARVNFTIQTYNGVKVYRNLSVGATVGVDWFSQYQIVPISLGLRLSSGDSKVKKVKTFAGIDAGYGFMWLNDESNERQEIDGGLVLSPMVGLLIPTGGNANFILSMGYKRNLYHSKIITGTPEFPNINETDYNLNRMAIRFGVSF
jgi:hypothetical protein